MQQRRNVKQSEWKKEKESKLLCPPNTVLIVVSFDFTIVPTAAASLNPGNPCFPSPVACSEEMGESAGSENADSLVSGCSTKAELSSAISYFCFG